LTIFLRELKLIFLTEKGKQKARLFLHNTTIFQLFYQTELLFTKKQVKLSERGKVMPNDFGENFKVILSIFNSIPITDNLLSKEFKAELYM